MSLDYSLLMLLAEELDLELSHAKVLKVQQPEKDLILISLRKSAETSVSDRNASATNSRWKFTRSSDGERI